MIAEFAPYIFFYGRCEEALEFYKRLFHGSYEATRTGDTPMADKVPPEARNRIMHATFKGPGITFMASDGMEEKSINPDEGNVCLCLTYTDGKGDEVFKALGEGGKVNMPLDKAFWGGRFGSVIDRFGIEWFVNIPNG